MGFLLLLIALIPGPKPSEQALMDFARFAKAIGEPIALVESDGAVREGRLAAAAADAVTMAFASGERVFQKDEIASADRLRDGTRDGFIKGALIGALLGVCITEAFGEGGDAGLTLRIAATYGVLGWGLDAANKNRQPIYRAAGKPKQPAIKLAVRF